MSKLPGFMMLATLKTGPRSGWPVDQAVEDAHVAVGQAGLLGGDHDVGAAQRLARRARRGTA